MVGIHDQMGRSISVSMRKISSGSSESGESNSKVVAKQLKMWWML